VIRRSSSLANVAAYAACVLIWGTTWLAIKVALHGFPTVTGAGVRFLVASAVLFAAGAIARVGSRNRPPVHLILVLAVTLFGFNYAMTYLAETKLPSGLVAVLFGTMPFFIFGFAHAMIGERARLATLVGALLALAGVATISLAGDARGQALYVLAALAASASSAFANVYLKKFARAEPLATLPPAMFLAGLGMVVYGASFEHTDWRAATTPSSLGAIAYLAVCGSALAFFLNHWLLQRVDAGIVGLSALMIPVVAVAVGTLFGGESFGARDLLGGVLVIGGVSLSMVRPRSHVKRTAGSQSAA
jgi:drug/metabolite transporter (DMT)-like permease